MPADDATPAGHAALIASLRLRLPSPYVQSSTGPGSRRTVIENGRTQEHYPARYAPQNNFVGQLRFALRYEPLDLAVLDAAFRTGDAAPTLTEWVAAEPNGAYARRAWFLYEWLTGERLDLPDAAGGNYADALDPALHVTAAGIPSRRHRVTDNLLGRPGLAPTVRRTKRLARLQAEGLDAEARATLAGADPDILARAVSYLYTKETRSSFEIERETATGNRAERFVAALRAAPTFRPTDPQDLVALQNVIVDPRYAARGFRDFQNFVGENVDGYREVVHFICPRPDDVAPLMAAWTDMTARLADGATDPIVAAALVAFAFVFIHPFEDGNGRIHRFLIHQVLSRSGFTPPDLLFPVSAAILRDRAGYDAVLETFSGSIRPCIDWHWAPGQRLVVENETARLYRYFDATPLAEYLYERIGETIRKDLREELEFVALFDAARSALNDIVDMPDRRASLLVRLCLQNDGVLSNAKRDLFGELADPEIEAIETAIAALLQRKNG